MKKISKKELKKVLNMHSLWLHLNGGEKADLSHTDLSRLDLFGVDLRNADLHGANLEGAKLSSARLSSANLSDAYMTHVDLCRADLHRANLRGANLSEAHLFRTCLVGADMRGANLREAYLCYSDMSAALLEDADLRGAYLSDINLQLSVFGEGRHIWTLDRIGSEKLRVIYDATDDKVFCGCFSGSFDEWRAEIENGYPNKDGVYRREFEAAIAYFETLKKIHGIK